MHKRLLDQLVAKRDLLYMLTLREIRVKYKQSVMGFMWAILMPALIVSAGVIVRAGFSVLSGKHLEVGDVASVRVRAIPWAFFVSTIRSPPCCPSSWTSSSPLWCSSSC